MLNILNEVNDFLWTYIVITLLVICAVYFTIKTKGVQFRSLKETWNLLKEKPKQSSAETDSTTNQKKKSVKRRQYGRRFLCFVHPHFVSQHRHSAQSSIAWFGRRRYLRRDFLILTKRSSQQTPTKQN